MNTIIAITAWTLFCLFHTWLDVAVSGDWDHTRDSKVRRFLSYLLGWGFVSR